MTGDKTKLLLTIFLSYSIGYGMAAYATGAAKENVHTLIVVVMLFLFALAVVAKTFLGVDVGAVVYGTQGSILLSYFGIRKELLEVIFSRK